MKLNTKMIRIYGLFMLLLGIGTLSVSAGEIILIPAAATVYISPGQNIQTIVNNRSPGTTFILRPGVHRMQSIRPKSGNTFIGEDGAILNGSKVLSGFIQENNYWYVTNQTQEGEYRIADWQMCDDTHPLCYRPEDLFISNIPLRHVSSTGQLTSGTWYFDYSRNRIYIGENPSGRTVEASVSPYAFRNSSADNVTIRNLTIEKYATGPSVGAIHAAETNGWEVDDVVVRLNHAAGINIGSDMTIKYSRIVNNGQVGLNGSQEANTLIRNNKVGDNNYAGFYLHWAVGGMKFTTSDNLIIRNNTVYNNYGPGIWLDIDTRNITVEGNTVTDNYRVGIFNEISFGGIIRNNVVKYNNPYGYGGQIFISNSSDIDVYNNQVVVGNQFESDGIRVYHTDRGSGPYGVRSTRNNWVHNNTVVYEGGKGRSGVSVQDSLNNATFWDTYNNRFNYNKYYTSNRSYEHFTWNNRYIRWGDFKNFGQETSGIFDALSARVLRVESVSSEWVITDISQPIEFSWTRPNAEPEIFNLVVRSASGVILDASYLSSDICFDLTCTVSVVLNLYEQGTHLWSVQSMASDGFSTISNGTFEVELAPPVSPTNQQVRIEQGLPVVSWQNGAGVSMYKVYIHDGQGLPVHDQWYPRSAAACDGVSCQLIVPAYLQNAAYTLYIQFWNPGGFALQSNGEWGDALTFEMALPAPVETLALTATNSNSGRPTFQWMAAPDATWYEVWVGTPSPDFELRHTAWYSALDLGCQTLGTCTLTPDMNLQDGVYSWYIRSWGPGGMSASGAGGWTEQPSFTVDAAQPVAPDLITPQGTIGESLMPDFTWKSVLDASWYHVEILAADQVTLVYDVWHAAEQVQCNGTSCLLDASSVYLPSGMYSWRVTAYTPKGVGPVSQNHEFTISN